MLYKKVLLLTSISGLFVLTGCQKRISPSKLSSVKIGMSKEEVVSQLGEPAIQRGSMMNDFKQLIDVYEYVVDRGPSREEYVAYTMLCICTLGLGAPLYFCMSSQLDYYWFIFVNAQLAKWCKAGDWETAQHNIQEIRFR